MDKETLHIKQMSLELFERILLQNEYSSKQEILLVAVKMCKDARAKKMPEMLIKAQDQALQMIKDLSFEEMREIKNILKHSPKN